VTLRSRVTLAAVVAVLVSMLGVAVLVHATMSRELRRQVDVTLQEQGDRLVSGPGPLPRDDPGAAAPVGTPSDDSLFTDSYLQALDADGTVVVGAGQADLPVTETALAIAAGTAGPAFEEVDTDGAAVRVYTVPTEAGALRFGRSLAEVERSLDRLTAAMVVIGLAGVLVAAILGTLAAATAIRPVHQLSETARTIKRTGDLRRRLPVRGRDEVASLAHSFNDVLDDLETSQSLQRQLVADASHELRTPLTTLRTNIEVLGRGHDLSELERGRILADLNGQLADLTDLVGDLVDLARDESVDVSLEALRLDEVALEVVARARRQRPMLRFDLDVAPTLVIAAPDRVDRAISNLVDNAAKWSPPEGTVRVVVADRTVSVADEGPGIDPEDLPHVFDRFYRARDARTMPGSGLGLAIVRQVAQVHGGTVEAANAVGGGAVLTLRFPAQGDRISPDSQGAFSGPSRGAPSVGARHSG
jgi:two-component system sensor histidine kinase MprB